MSKRYPACFRTTNWSSFNASLRKRGSLLTWIDKDMTRYEPRDRRIGRPPVFSDTAIQFGLSVKVLFKLPLRQTAGMFASLLRMAGVVWPVPDFSTLCRRQKTLALQIPYCRADGPLNLLIPSCDIAAQSTAGQWTAPGSSSWAMANGRRASTAFRVDANGARCIWRWIWPHQTSAPWNSPPAATATDRSFLTCSAKFQMQSK